MAIIELTMGTGLYPEHPLETVNRAWAEKIYDDTGGMVHIRIIDVNSAYLGPKSDQNLMKRVDIALRPAFMLPRTGSGPNIASVLPSFFYDSDVACARNIFNDLWREFPEIKEEYVRVRFNEFWKETLDARPGHFSAKRLCGHATTGPYLSTRSKPVQRLSDFKGLRIAGIGAGWFEKVGAIPVTLPEFEIFPALKEGTLDGIFFFLPPTHVENRKLLILSDVTNFSTSLYGSLPPNDYYAVKTDMWDRLPGEVKKIIESSLLWFEEELEKSLLEQERRAIDVARARGHEFIKLQPDDLKELKGLLEAEAVKGAAGLDDRGLPGMKMFMRARSLIESYCHKD
jgi:hypothetical protein